MKILSDVEDLVTEATKAKADCHVGEEAGVQAGPNYGKCITDLLELGEVVDSLVSDIENKDFGHGFTDLTSLMADVKDLTNDCTSHVDLTLNPSSCLSDITDIATQAKNLFAMVKSRNIDLNG